MVQATQIPYLLPYFLSLATSAGIMIYTWRRRTVYPAAYYTLTIFWGALTTVAYILEISSDQLNVKLFWDNGQWLTLFGEAISLLVFALHFIQRPPVRPFRLWITLSLFPTAFMLLVATNSRHGLIRTDAHIIPGEPFSALTYTFTPLTYAAGAYLLIIAFIVIGLLAVRLARVEPIYRGQIATILTGVALPTFTGLLTIMGVTLTLQRDITPIAFAIGNLVVAYGLFHYRLFDVAPIARETIFENMAEAVIVIDMYKRIVDMNPAASRLIGCQKGGVAGKHVVEVFGHWPDFLERYQDVAQPVQDEIEVGCGDARRIFALSLSPIHARGDFRVGWVAVLRDVTERRLAEEALVQRTQELEVARAAAEQSDRAKSQFLASVSHELRTPLNAIINFTQFVSAGMYGPVNEKQVDALGKSTGSAHHLLGLINDVLDMSKIEAGRLELMIEDDMQLQDQLDAAYEIAQSMIHDKPVKLLQEIQANLPALSGDRQRIRQILLNLVSNAAKFTEEGHIRLRAWCEDTCIIVAVEDTGPGIAAEEQETIFEPFQQLKRSGGLAGTGLGLPISRRLAEAHGGRLWLESQTGTGSTFYVSLPVYSDSWISLTEDENEKV